MKTKNLYFGVMHFTKCSMTSTLASAKIARFIMRVLMERKDNCCLIDDKHSALGPYAENLDVLFIVNSPFGFCDWREEALEVCKKAECIIWVQNDYAIKPPSQFKSHDIKIFKCLSTCEGPGNVYMDWNKLTFDLSLTKFRSKKAHQIYGLFYYGAYRENRESSFKKYFNQTLYPPLISTTPKSRQKFMDINSHRNSRYFDPFTSLSQITMFQTSIYIEDDGSHGKMHSLANRFYEMLSAGLAICIDKDSEFIFKHYNIPRYAEFLVNDFWNVNDIVKQDWRKWASLQRELWVRDYTAELRHDLNSFLDI